MPIGPQPACVAFAGYPRDWLYLLNLPRLGGGHNHSENMRVAVAKMSRIARLSASTILVSAAFGPALAQDAASPFYATLEVDRYYTDNVYFSRPLFTQRRLDDWVTVVKPSVGYRHEFDKGRVNLNAYAEIGRYSRYSSEDYEDYGISADGRHIFSPTTLAVWGAGLARGHEARNSLEPSDLVGTNPTEYWKGSAYGAIAHRFGDDTVKLGFTYDRYDYDDARTTVFPFTVNQDDRDRDMATLGARYTHALSETSRVFAEGTLDWRDYRSAADDNGFTRDSHGLRAALGWQGDLGQNASVELFGGVLYQDFSDGSFDSILAPDFGARYSWQEGGTSLDAQLSRSLEETTLSGTSSYLKTTGRVQARQDLPGNLRVYAGLAVSDLDFRDSSRRDLLTDIWLGARRYLSPNFFIGAEAAFQESESTVATNDYTETRIMARVGIDTAGAYDPEASSLPWGWSGIYVGAGGEITHLGTMMDGPRQNSNGSLTADFGAFGLAGRVIAGWGGDIGNTYLGFEADYGMSHAEWNHSRLPGGRVFSVNAEETMGFSLLAGRRLAGGTLAYGRAGIRSTNFVTDYATENASATIEDHLTGFELGVGLRTPVSDSLALSLEYAHVRYSDYAAGAGGGTPDRFANVEDSIRLALTYHFGGIAGAARPQPVLPDYSGAYWGVQAGVGAHSSLTRGNRQDDSVLTADFGDHGFTGGGVLGYNFQQGRFVAGAELEGDASHQAWEHERMPAGRTFSLRKHATLGISGRAGYVLDGGALLYGRIGAVTSFFRNDFSNPGATLAKEEWRGGLRYGGGVEVPLADNSRLRADYTYTDYGTLSLSTPPGVETYETAEGLFRLGFVKKF